MNARLYFHLPYRQNAFMVVAMLIVLVSMPQTMRALTVPSQPIRGPLPHTGQALAQALYFDRLHAVHLRPVEAVDVALPYLTTRQAYVESRGAVEGFADPNAPDQRVWVVTISGTAFLLLPGASVDQPFAEITYLISVETGELVGVTAQAIDALNDSIRRR
jgi:hypothetical protein